MKIVMLSEDFLPNVGGITSHIVYLSEALVGLGHNVVVVKPGQGEQRTFADSRGFEITHLKAQGSRLKDIAHVHAFLKNYGACEGVDIVHWHQLVGYETKFLKNVARVFTNHTSMYLEQYEYAFKRLQLRLMLSHVDAIISPSRELEAKSSFLKPRVGNYYIPNGVDDRRFIPAQKISKLDERLSLLMSKKDEGNSLILCPRRLEPKCGVEYFVRALPEILKKRPNTYAVMAGRGGFFQEQNRLMSILESNGIADRALFLGDVPNEDMPALYDISDAVVLPSLMEATSISCLEAMACAKPIVATRVGGLPELLEDQKSGLLVKPYNSGELAGALLEVLDNREHAKNLGLESRKRVQERFTWKAIAQQTCEVYQDVIDYYARARH